MNIRTGHWFGIAFVVSIDGSSWPAVASLAIGRSGAAVARLHRPVRRPISA